jgi:hypothetical protein
MRSRPGSCASGILRKKVNRVLDADIRDFFRTAEEAASPAGRSASALERLADAAERIVELLSPA